ncbi:AI-2E family transporter [Streptosporangium sp. KLBMP 9127]|nr:AI-2E family transporter [Streptosporangium sp. KLBMP 9127]
MSFSRGLRLLLGMGAAVLVLFGIQAVSEVAGPAFLALTLIIAVSPLRVWLRRRGAPGWLLVTVPLLVILLVIVALIASLAISIAQLAALLPAYATQYTALLAEATRWLGTFGVTPEQVQAVLRGIDPGRLLAVAQGLLTSLLGIATALLLVILLAYGMSLDATFLQDAIRALAPARPELVGALREFARGTCRYLVVTSVFGLIVAVLDALALWLIGVPLPLLWGLLAFITNYIPNIGFVVGLVPPALLALLDSGPVTMIWVIVIYSALNFVIQSLIQPKFAGRSAGLSTTLTIMSLLVWTLVLGPLGAVLAVPLSALVRALLVDADPETRWAIPLITGGPGEVTGARAGRPRPPGGTSGRRRSSP